MSQSRLSPAKTQAIIAQLAQKPRITRLDPIAARFVYSLRLVAMHERVRRDPVPELASRLGSVDLAAKTLALSQIVCATWPENVRLSPFCCCQLSHDEATIGQMVSNAIGGDRQGFDAVVSGLVRADRTHRLWDAAVALATAEALALGSKG